MAVREFLLHSSSPFYPFMFGLLTFLFGIWLLMPFDLFAVSSTWNFIAQYISESALGFLAAVLGGVQMYLSVMKQKVDHALTNSAQIAFYFWLILAISAGVGDWHGFSAVIFAWLSIMSGLGYLNAKINLKKDSDQ